MLAVIPEFATIKAQFSFNNQFLLYCMSWFSFLGYIWLFRFMREVKKHLSHTAFLMNGLGSVGFQFYSQLQYPLRSPVYSCVLLTISRILVPLSVYLYRGTSLHICLAHMHLMSVCYLIFKYNHFITPCVRPFGFLLLCLPCVLRISVFIWCKIPSLILHKTDQLHHELQANRDRRF